MTTFINKKTGELKQAFSIRNDGDKIYVKFTENGKEYAYNKETIGFEQNEKSNDLNIPFITYCYERECYRCKNKTHIITYIVFDDSTNESAVFPWDKPRALENQNILAHIQDPSIEYYGIKIVGEVPEFDEILMKKYPERIAVRYSNVIHRAYPMNLCEHCQAPQGKNYIYRYANVMIQKMKPIDTI